MYQPKGRPKDSSRNVTARSDDQAFRELQQYADFQNVLSQRLSDDIEEKEPPPWYRSIDTQSLDYNDIDGAILFNGEINSTLQRHVPLPNPVVIAANVRNCEIATFDRAYSPSLMDCEIDQNTFLHFIDTFNDTIKVCHILIYI